MTTKDMLKKLLPLIIDDSLYIVNEAFILRMVNKLVDNREYEFSVIESRAITEIYNIFFNR